MPTLWTDTIDTHRREVREAILHTTVALVSAHGLAAVTMSQIAERTGIGRATLYQYFPGVEPILFAWHQRQIGEHLRQLREIRDQPGTARQRLAAVLGAYALIAHESRRHAGGELAALVHRDAEVARAQHQLDGFIRELLSQGVRAGQVRNDIAASELAAYCLHALSAAGSLGSKAAVRRLVALTLDALRPPR